MDISKPLPQCSKLRSNGKQIGLVGLKYERLPNFCYWCGQVTHGERDYEVWLRGRRKLRREDQQYGEWLRVELIRQGRKTVVVISGKAHQQPLWWKKGQLCQGKDTLIPRRGGENHDAQSAMEAKHYMDNFETIKDGPNWVVCEHCERQSNAFSCGQNLKQPNSSHVARLDEQVVGLSL